MRKFQKINELLELIDKSHILFIATNIDHNLLSDLEKETLKDFGIDIDSVLLDKNTKFDELYKFGILAETLQQEKVKTLSYENFKKYLDKNKYFPLTKDEKLALEQIKYQAYSDIKGLGNKVKKGVLDEFIEIDKNQRKNYESIIQEELEEAIYWRKTTKEMALSLGNKTQDWSRDFDRIADYLMHNVLDSGIAAGIIRRKGINALVYKDVYNGACLSCINTYLKNGIGSEPILFKVGDLISNGNNIKRKQKDWKAVIGPLHPFCRCTLQAVPENSEWDKTTNSFNKIKENTNQRIKGKVKIKISQ
jgi:hypothetical protein